MNRRAKFDAISFILGGEIRNRTNKHKKTVNDIPHIAYRHVWITIALNVVNKAGHQQAEESFGYPVKRH